MFPVTLQTLPFCRQCLTEILDAAGNTQTWARPGENVSFSKRLIRSFRMGADPKTPVINADRRACDLSNLFLVDRSSFAVCGRWQSTGTIQALAFRASDRNSAPARSNSI